MPITNFEEITETLTENEMLMLPYVEKAFGKITCRENIRKSNEICDLINMYYVHENGIDKDFVPMNGVRLRKFVNYLRSNGILPIIGTSEGYFVNYQREELEKQIKSLKERANGILNAAAGLEKFII